MRRMLVGLVVGWALGAVPSAAQTLVGAVTEEGSGRPVPGAMVHLLDGERPSGPRFLTGVDGRYRLEVPGPGSYRLAVERIGFTATRSALVDVAEGQTVVAFDLTVVPAPVRLAGMDVEGDRRRCDLSQDVGGRTQATWDEARKALAAASWTEREAGLTFEIGRRVRRLDRDGRNVLDESRQVARGVGGNSVRTLEPEDLVEGGYVRDEDGYLFYYGPDAAVLLSDAFLDTHCFSLVADGEAAEVEGGVTGLAFEPVDGRDTTDIRGTMWLDARTLRLDRVEFTYTGLPRLPGRELARGEVRFLELPDGRWIVRDWYIQVPLLAERRALGAGGAARDRYMVTGVQELGSEVMRVEGPDGVVWTPDIPARTDGSGPEHMAGGRLPPPRAWK